MTETRPVDQTLDPATAPAPDTTAAERPTGPVAIVRALREQLAAAQLTAQTDAEAIDLAQELEAFRNELDSARTLNLHNLDRLRRQAEKKAGIPRRDRGKGLNHETSNALHITPGQAAGLLNTSRTVHEHMPHAAEALRTGREKLENLQHLTSRLASGNPTDDQLAAVDAELADTYGTTTKFGLARTGTETLDRIDPAQATARAKAAYQARFFKITPAANGMSRVSGSLPAEVALRLDQTLDKRAHAALRNKPADPDSNQPTDQPVDPAADPITGERRNHRQLRADLLADAVLAPPSDGTTPKPVTEIQLVMNLDTFFGLPGCDPVYMVGHGELPAAVERKRLANPDIDVFIRRLFKIPGENALVKMDSHRRFFEGNLRRWIMTNNDRCANPYCDNPAKVADHVTAHAKGGPTSAANAQGLCEYCDAAKQNRGWTTTVLPDGSVEQITPTGHRTVRPPKNIVDRFGDPVSVPDPVPTADPTSPDPPPDSDDPPDSDPEPDLASPPEEPPPRTLQEELDLLAALGPDDPDG